MKEKPGLGATVRSKISNFKSLNKWRKWVKCYCLMSTVLFALGLGLTVLFLIDDYANSQQAYEGIEIDPDGEAQIWLNFTRLDQMKIYIPIEIENLDKFDITRNIQAEMALKIEYFDLKSNSEEEITIFSTKKDDIKNVLPSETTEFSLSADDGKDEDWDWDTIYKFQTQANPNRKISVLLDLTISLTSGFDSIWLIYKGVDLSAESQAQVPIESSTSKKESVEKSGKSASNQKGQIYTSGFDSKNVLLFTLYISFSLFLLSFGVRQLRQSKKKSKGIIIKQRSQKLRKIEVIKALIRGISFTAFFIVWDCIILVQLQDESLQEVATKTYVNNYQTSLIASIIVSCIVALLVALPIFFSREFKSYSVSRAALNLLIKLLILFQMVIYLFLTAYTTFEFKHAILIIDSRASYMWFFALLFVQIGLAVVHAIILRFKKSEFESMRSEQKIKVHKKKKQILQLLKNKEELNYIIFKAIEKLEKESTYNNIQGYFRRNQQQFRTRTGDQLSKQYLNALVKKGLLLIETQDTQRIYYLTEHGEESVKEFENKTSKEDEKEREKEKEHQEIESLKEASETPEFPESTEIKDEFGRIDRDLMTARSNPEYQKLGYCSKCKMTNPIKKGKCTVCGSEIK